MWRSPSQQCALQPLRERQLFDWGEMQRSYISIICLSGCTQSHLSKAFHSRSVSGPAMATPAAGAQFVVASEESLNRFEAPFVDEHTGAHYTVSFFLREPVLYHPAHLAKRYQHHPHHPS